MARMILRQSRRKARRREEVSMSVARSRGSSPIGRYRREVRQARGAKETPPVGDPERRGAIERACDWLRSLHELVIYLILLFGLIAILVLAARDVLHRVLGSF